MHRLKTENEVNRLPYPVIHTLLTDPTFAEIVSRCLEEEELIAGFCRIYEVELPRPPMNGVETMIDKVTGYQDESYREFFTAFIPFVHRVVYLPLKVQINGAEKGVKT